jgi:hypothetical protein
MGRNHLAHAANAVVAAGYNFRRLPSWLMRLLRLWLGGLIKAAGSQNLIATA